MTFEEWKSRRASRFGPSANTDVDNVLSELMMLENSVATTYRSLTGGKIDNAYTSAHIVQSYVEDGYNDKVRDAVRGIMQDGVEPEPDPDSVPLDFEALAAPLGGKDQDDHR